MEHRLPTRLTASEGRRFAFPVGIAFGLLAGLLVWRGLPTGAWAVASLSGILLLAGALAPTRLGPIQRGWMALALAMSRVTTPIFMGIVYFLVLTPTALVLRLVGYDPLRRDPDSDTFWVDRPEETGPRSDLSRQF
jgi:hypothetical protein